MAYKKLSDLTTEGQTWSIKAKVIRVWDSINNATDELISMDMILMDEQNDAIHGTIWKGLLNTYRPQINEGSIYVFSNFKVEGSIRYRPLCNEKKNKRNTPSEGTKDIRVIELLLFDGEKVRVTLWGELAHYISEDLNENQTVIIVTSTMVESFNVTSLKTTSATRLYKDMDITDTWKLIQRYSHEENLPKMMEVNKSIQGTQEEQMFYNRKTLQKITEMRHENPLNNEEFIYTSRVNIDQLQENTMCKVDDNYYCNNCDKYPKGTTPRYWLRLQISDHITSTTCTIFDDEAQRLLKINVTALLESLNGRTDEIPKNIHNLYGESFIFRFKLNNQNLTEGKPGYLVKKKSVPDDKLEAKFLNDIAEKSTNLEYDHCKYSKVMDDRDKLNGKYKRLIN
ncbi:hypothetical protein PVAP13_7KG183400 [Panicum virgatum]|uniref:Uncharacterized protein n=1 Tax=Panicum virgatum TaxID=38727 RepID=A0A8T0QFG9_PANVG|nr:hypothetical protein PVAP13_7KG183400 [Panicum virgatum]